MFTLLQQLKSQKQQILANPNFTPTPVPQPTPTQPANNSNPPNNVGNGNNSVLSPNLNNHVSTPQVLSPSNQKTSFRNGEEKDKLSIVKNTVEERALERERDNREIFSRDQNRESNNKEKENKDKDKDKDKEKNRRKIEVEEEPEVEPERMIFIINYNL